MPPQAGPQSPLFGTSSHVSLHLAIDPYLLISFAINQ